MGITTKDLAQMCGVSRTTIHRALNGSGRIHPDTKELILRTAQEQKYRPDLLARSLVKGKTFSIGIVVLDVRNRYFSAMVSAIGAELNKRGYCMNIMLHDEQREKEKEQLLQLAAYHMDGIILSSVNEGEEYRDFLEGLGVPVVTVDNKVADGVPFVGIDQRAAMAEAARFVAKKGYEKLVYVCPPMDSQDDRNTYVHRERLCGFKEVCREFPEIQAEYRMDWSYLEHLEETLQDGKRTAFICTADNFALDIMKELRKSGLRVPTDYGITGFDNIDTLDYVSPRLMTVSNGVDAVAVAAVDRLFAMIEGTEVKESSMILPHQLIMGETV